MFYSEQHQNKDKIWRNGQQPEKLHTQHHLAQTASTHLFPSTSQTMQAGKRRSGWNPVPGWTSASYTLQSVQSLSHVRLSATPWIAAHQASLSITNSRSSLKLMSIESVMPSSHLNLCCPLFFLPPIPPSIRVFSNELALLIRWPKY